MPAPTQARREESIRATVPGLSPERAALWARMDLWAEAWSVAQGPKRGSEVRQGAVVGVMKQASEIVGQLLDTNCLGERDDAIATLWFGDYEDLPFEYGRTRYGTREVLCERAERLFQDIKKHWRDEARQSAGKDGE